MDVLLSAHLDERQVIQIVRDFLQEKYGWDIEKVEPQVVYDDDAEADRFYGVRVHIKTAISLQSVSELKNLRIERVDSDGK